MIYPENIEHKIDFDKIRNLISSLCQSTLGKERVDEMHFSSDYAEIVTEITQTEEFVQILQNEDSFPSDNFYDIREVLQRLRIEGTWIEQTVLFNLNRTLYAINNIALFFGKEEEIADKYPCLYHLCEDIVVFPDISRRIEQIIDNFGQIKDNASPRLSQIRIDLTSTMSGISRSLNSILRKAQSEGYVDKDVSPSMRDGRLVIPINPSHKRKIRGIVHDESASGKTIFIEPAEVVEANNRIRELENEERREIINILTDFTDYLRPFIPDLINSYILLAEIDFIRAKARFAININAIKPNIEDIQIIDWVHAVHPLLFLSFAAQNRKVVPLDITLEGENRILVISGPNAGGKSVCLKTVGLLQYMIQNGLLVPMKENSRVGIFKDIFIDIGDEQSIEDDLSTYSSHLLNMKFFDRNCNNKSLLLIDEFGSGTEPQIGAAIAESILNRFNQKFSFGVITTHYQNLKHFANETKGVINGAMLYDRHQMQPLFQLSIGNPGSSFAVEIATKIGLPKEVIDYASSIVGSDYINMDKYLQDISRDKRYWERKRDEIRRERKRLDEITQKYETDLGEIKKQKKEILAQAKEEAQRIIEKSNAVIESTIKTIKETQADKERTKAARKNLTQFKEEIVKRETKESNKDKHKRKDKLNVKPIKKEEKREGALQKDESVRLKGQTSIGQIIEIKGDRAVIAFGMIKSTIEIGKLERVNNNQIGKKVKNERISSVTSDLIHERKLQFKQDIDVRGMRGDEALQAVVYFIDDALQLGMHRVRILHGTGTGALRQVIRDYLKGVRGVTHFQDEHVQFGGAGITVIDLE